MTMARALEKTPLNRKAKSVEEEHRRNVAREILAGMDGYDDLNAADKSAAVDDLIAYEDRGPRLLVKIDNDGGKLMIGSHSSESSMFTDLRLTKIFGTSSPAFANRQVLKMFRYFRDSKENPEGEVNAALSFIEADAEKEARVSMLAREYDMPTAVISADLPGFEAQARARRAQTVMGQYPAIAGWSQKGNNAAIAADDFDGLAQLGRVFDAKEWQKRRTNQDYWKRALAGNGELTAARQPEPTLMNSIKGLAVDFVQGGVKAREGLSLAFADWTHFLVPKAAPGAPSLGDFSVPNAMQRYQRADDRAEASRPAFKSKTAEGLYAGASSLAQMASGIAASIATANPAPALLAAGGQTGFDSYGKYRSRGGTRGQAALGGALEGGIEVVTEKLPMGFLVESLGKVGAGRFLSGYLGREFLTEQAATHAQDAVDTAIANPDKTWGEYLAERPDAAYKTALATLVTSGALAGVNRIASKMQQRADSMMEAHAGAMLLDGLEKAARSSKTAQRDPDAFAALAQQLGEEAGVDRVFIPAEAVVAYLTADADNQYFGEPKCPWQI